MNRCCFCLAALVMLAGGTGHVWAGGVAVSSTLALEADSDAGSGNVQNTSAASQGATINPLAAAVDALAVSGNASVESTAVGNATWTSPNVGSLVLSNVGWTTQNVASGSAFLFSGLDYTYTFMPNLSGTFTLNFSMTSGGSSTFGLNGFSYNFNNTDFQVFDLSGPASGTVTESIVAGNTYFVNIRNAANISGVLGTRDAHMTGTFDFNFPSTNAVPEPGSFILLGLGVVGLAGFARMRRPAAA